MKDDNHKYLKIEFLGNVDNRELDNFLLNNIDVMFAMGTAALEAARLAIPTVLLDVSYVPIKDDYIFKFLFDTVDYTLGDVIDEHHFKSGNKSFENIMDSVINDYAEVSTKTYNYFVSNHELEQSIPLLLEKLEKNNVQYNELYKNGFTRIDWSTKLYHFVRYGKINGKRQFTNT